MRIDNVDRDTGLFASGMRKLLEAATPSADTVNYREWRDPIPDIQKLGDGLSVVGGGLIASGTFASVLGPFGQQAGSYLSSLGWIFFFAAFLVAGIIPLLPLIYWAGGVFSWFTAVLSMLVALPIWLLSFMMPSRQTSFVGSSVQGLMLILGVLLKPVLLIAGLIAAMLLMRVAFDLWNYFMMNAYGATAGVTLGSFSGMMLLVGITVVFSLGLLVLVMWSCGFISELGDATLRYLDGQAAALFNNRFGQDASGVVNPTSRGAAALSGVGTTTRDSYLRGQAQLGGSGQRLIANVRRLPNPKAP